MGAWIPALFACAAADPAGRGPPASPVPAPVPLPPNVLVIVADDLGTDKVAGYEEHPAPPPTPNLDALAASGVLFRNAWSYPNCSPSRAALLTGRYGRRTGVGAVLDPDTAFALADREQTVAEILPPVWSTAFVGKWHLAGYRSPDYAVAPGAQGFDWYSVALMNLQDSRNPWAADEGYYHWEEDRNGVFAWQSTYATTAQVDEALGQMAEMQPPWLMMLLLNAPHTPFDLPPDDLYDVPIEPGYQPDYHAAIVQAMDAEIGRLLQGVDLDDTLVVFTADNGTTSVAITPPRSPDEGKLTVFEGGINVPLFVAGPGVPHGEESAALVHLVDVFATVADVADVPLDALTDESGGLWPIDGESLLPLAREPARSGRRVVYTESFRPLGVALPYDADVRVVRDARFKLVSNDNSGLVSLYDLAGRLDDGPDLLAAGPLSSEAATGLADLSASLDELRAELVPPAPP
jgi:arylsulfatase A-like enzyme